jgi:hypothetical protein
MKPIKSSLILTILIPLLANAKPGIRKISSTSCQVIRVNLGLGMTTQIVLDDEPQVTLYADKKHFKINTNSVSPRSVSVIPFVESSELNVFRKANGKLPSAKALAASLDNNFKTNLFIFFKNNNQLMFELRFVEKKKADYILKVKQVFNKDCAL